ncbi:MAG: hypothetical protein AYP45_03130 [Candidatus Brocadia carolinensis]|uniref:Uncharacterized protein n=1 Tax=Candidatus Brocadia carolinensis TaxID=1004156 RepID=A0A1V4AWG0_9BACT|nr:MAG: hypothetical protein AYP45_03130 [Candidatus Brocadia caroliniensis]
MLPFIFSLSDTLQGLISYNTQFKTEPFSLLKNSNKSDVAMQGRGEAFATLGMSIGMTFPTNASPLLFHTFFAQQKSLTTKNVFTKHLRQ